MRLAGFCTIAAIGVALGCSRSNPAPTPLPEITIAADASPNVRCTLEGLQSPSPKRRALAIVQLSALGDTGESVTPYLLQALEDPNHLVRVRVVEVLGTVGDEAAIQPLIAHLKDKSEDRDVRARAAEALGLLEATEAVEPLVVALDDMFWHIRHHAIVALGRIGDRRAEGVLQRAVEYDPDFDNRETAKRALESLRSSESLSLWESRAIRPGEGSLAAAAGGPHHRQ